MTIFRATQGNNRVTTMLQTELKSSALEYFEEMKVKLVRSDL